MQTTYWLRLTSCEPAPTAFRANKFVECAGSLPMTYVKRTIAISREELTRGCLRELHLWPGCETIERLGVLGDLRGRFTVHVIDYGLAKKHVADRAVRCIQREKSRQYHLKME
jgi:hypothetical protein